MLNKFKNRKKGVAIEISIIALVVVFAISTLLVSISVMANAIGKNALSDQQEKTQLAEFAISCNLTQIDAVEEKGDYTITPNGNTYTIKKTTNGTFTLTVTVESGKITSWKFD